MDNTVKLAIELIQKKSVTPVDNGCQRLIADLLQSSGFKIEPLKFGHVDNLWARRGHEAPLLVFLGHTDVVPPGELEAWQFPPFESTIHNGFLYGRGSADMKAGVAAMTIACQRFVEKHPKHQGSIGFLLTSDEEGPAIDGTVKVVEQLQTRQEKIDWCLVGEPSSEERAGDTIKNGRRGSLSGDLIIYGTQGHVAYPHLANNPIHCFAPLLNELIQTEWDRGNAFFPPTSFQVVNINAGTGASNVIPGQFQVKFNFRYCTEVTHEQLQAKIETLLEKHQLNYQITWNHSGFPFVTEEGKLIQAAQAAVQEICGYMPGLSTGGGTSDGRFIAPTGAEVIELGPINATIHKANECVKVEDLVQLALIYERILEKLLLI